MIIKPSNQCFGIDSTVALWACRASCSSALQTFSELLDLFHRHTVIEGMFRSISAIPQAFGTRFGMVNHKFDIDVSRDAQLWAWSNHNRPALILHHACTWNGGQSCNWPTSDARGPCQFWGNYVCAWKDLMLINGSPPTPELTMWTLLTLRYIFWRWLGQSSGMYTVSPQD